MDSTVRSRLEECNRNFTASIKPDRFKGLVRCVHSPGSDDKIGEWRGLCNTTTGETFIYHHDTQKGVGKKYNYAKGFIRSTERAKVTEHKNRIPVYDYYKVMFESCDRFNRRLHDKSWPHRRGGNAVSGEAGVHHDFLLACVLQNTFNAYFAATGQNYEGVSFKDFCHDLADSLIM